MARKRGGAPAGAVRQRHRPHYLWTARLEAELALERWLRRQGLDPETVLAMAEGGAGRGATA